MDLNAPLGMRPSPSRRRGVPLLIAACLVAGLGVVGIGYVLATADPHGGEPYAVAILPPPVPKAAPIAGPATPSAAPVPTDPTPTGTSSRPGIARFDGGTVEQGVKVYRGDAAPAAPVPPSAQRPLIIDVTRALDDPFRKRNGGKTPSLAAGLPESAATKPAAAPPPRVAIFVGGMGLSASATRTAIETMPPAVTLAFLPYGATAAASVAAARAKGHEILLQLPMQSAGGGNPGPHTLRPDAAPDATAADLAWLMGRFDGYSGVTNLLGAPVTASEPAMTAVLKAVGARNLYFVDDGTSKRSLASSLAPSLNVAAAQADVVLDATADPAVVRSNLDTLVRVAREKGQAIGMASGLPEHLGAIARFAGELAGQGVSLVPVSALVRRDAGVASAR